MNPSHWPSEADSPLEASLRRLVQIEGTDASVAEALVVEASGSTVRNSLLPCLASEPGASFTEMQALTIIVRLLATPTGDLNGDAMLLARGAATKETVDPEQKRIHQWPRGVDSVLLELRAEEVLLAVHDLLWRHATEFECGELPYLRLEGTRALRLLVTPDPLLVGGSYSPTAFWGQQAWSHLTSGETPRLLIDLFALALQGAEDSMGQRPRAAAIGGLWSLATRSSFNRTRILQAGVTPLVLKVLRSQIYAQGPQWEDVLIASCALLAVLCASRSQERVLAKFGIHKDLVEMLRRCKLYKSVVCAGFLLLGVVARDGAAMQQLLSNPADVTAIAAARDRWKDAVEQEIGSATQRVQPIIHHVLGLSPHGAEPFIEVLGPADRSGEKEWPVHCHPPSHAPQRRAGVRPRASLTGVGGSRFAAAHHMVGSHPESGGMLPPVVSPARSQWKHPLLPRTQLDIGP